MKQFFRKFVVGALSSLFLIQACQTPNSNIINLDNKNQSFNVKNIPCYRWQVRSFNNDNDQSVSVNGQEIYKAIYYPNQDSGLIDINHLLTSGHNNVSFFTYNLHNNSPHSWGYEIYKDGQVIFNDVGYIPVAFEGQTHNADFDIYIESPLNICIVPTPTPSSTPTPTPTATPTDPPPTIYDCSKKSINNFNQNIDASVDALNKLANLFSAIAPVSTSGFKTKGFYTSPMYDQGEYRESVQILQDRLQEVKAMQFSADESERQAWAEAQQKLNEVGLLAAGLATGGMAAAPSFITTLAGASPEVILLAMESPQIINAIGQAATIVTALKILKNSEQCLSPALASGVNSIKSGLSYLDDTLNGIVKAVGKYSQKIARAEVSVKAAASTIKNLSDNFPNVNGANDLKNEIVKIKNLLESKIKELDNPNLTPKEEETIKKTITGYTDNIRGFEGEVNTALKLKNEGKNVVGFERLIPNPVNPSLQYTDIDIITKEVINGVEKEVLHQVKTGDASKKWDDFGDQLTKTGEVAQNSTPKSNVVFHYEKSPTGDALKEIDSLKTRLAQNGVTLEIRPGVTYTNLNGK